MLPMSPWTYRADRYYHPWWGPLLSGEPSDGQIKSRIVDRLRENPYTKDRDRKVDVKQPGARRSVRR